jgi:3-methyladenine DNA glycosylase/8-oxoguanine DNA glycosylase
MARSLYINIPGHFNFRSTVYSHGWCELAPFSLDVKNWRLSYVFRLGDEALPVTISEEDGRIKIEPAREVSDKKQLLRDVRHILRLDDDLVELYELLAAHERLTWMREKGAGRMLRSPTVWEDLVKTICTTNCSWGLTKIMVNNLVEKVGVGGAFPTADSMAGKSEKFFRTNIKTGYRSPYFIELANAVASGKLDPEEWLRSELPTAELKKEMKKVKGVGDYAAENLLKLVGRYDGLALDSWLRSQFYKNHNKQKACNDKKIERHYKKFGKWRGLVIWCDMTEKWIN